MTYVLTKEDQIRTSVQLSSERFVDGLPVRNLSRRLFGDKLQILRSVRRAKSDTESQGQIGHRITRPNRTQNHNVRRQSGQANGLPGAAQRRNAGDCPCGTRMRPSSEAPVERSGERRVRQTFGDARAIPRHIESKKRSFEPPHVSLGNPLIEHLTTAISPLSPCQRCNLAHPPRLAVVSDCARG